jgi:hypothetical protein
MVAMHGDIMKLRILVALLMFYGVSQTANALPSFARKYNTSCNTCHTYAPKLNAFGRAFQANYLNLPKDSGLKVTPTFPISVLTTTRTDSNDVTRSQLAVEGSQFVAADSYSNQDTTISYLLDVQAYGTNRMRQGTIKKGYVAGRMGAFGVAIGQTSPLSFQYDAANRLTDALPLALSVGIDGIALTDPVPTLRLDMFGDGTQGSFLPAGTRLSLGVTADGALGFRDGATVGSQHGSYVIGSLDRMGKRYGVMSYLSGGAALITLSVQQDVNNRLSVLAAGTHVSSGGVPTAGTLEADYSVSTRVVVTGRLDVASRSDFLAAASWYPCVKSRLRVSAEASTRANRTGVVARYYW